MKKHVSIMFYVTMLMQKRNDCEISSHCQQTMHTKLTEIYAEILQLSQQLCLYY